MELQDAKHRLGILHDMVQDGEALRTKNGKCKTVIKELWANIQSMKLTTILAIARARQYESKFESIIIYGGVESDCTATEPPPHIVAA